MQAQFVLLNFEGYKYPFLLSAFLSFILMPAQNLHSLMFRHVSYGLFSHTDASLTPVPWSNRSHLLATDFPATAAPLRGAT